MWCDVGVETCWSENTPYHDVIVHCGVGGFVEVVLDIVFGDEMRDVGGGFDGEFTAAVDGGEDEEGNFVDDGGVDEGFALTLFRFGGRAGSEGYLITIILINHRQYRTCIQSSSGSDRQPYRHTKYPPNWRIRNLFCALKYL